MRITSDELLHSTKALSIQYRQVSWLVTFLPSFPFRMFSEQWTMMGKNLLLLTVAGQLVVLTQFPFNPDLTREPLCFESKELGVKIMEID